MTTKPKLEELNSLLNAVRPLLIDEVFINDLTTAINLFEGLRSNKPEGADHYHHILYCAIILGALKATCKFAKNIGLDKEAENLFSPYTESEMYMFMGLMDTETLLLANEILL